MKVAFVENKKPDLRRVAQLLERCHEQNSWANRGPLYRHMREAYAEYMTVPPGTELVPVANAGAALEAMARLLAKHAGRRLCWVGSPFSFWNLGRGYFADMRFVDCDDRGLLDLAQLGDVDPAAYDGFILTNPFGLYTDISAYTAFARRHGKSLIVDNASGVHTQIPDWHWQAFSLHQTKPHGVGEGGLALVHADLAEELYDLVNYGEGGHRSEHWFQNAKLSDISCAFHIDRLERAKEWRPLYEEQRQRVCEIARAAGLRPLAEPESGIPMTSMPFVAPKPIAQEAIQATKHLTFAKYYKPLSAQPVVTRVYENIVNISCHADIAKVGDLDILQDILSCLEPRKEADAVLAGTGAPLR